MGHETISPDVRPLREYFLNIVVWSVLAVPLFGAVAALGMGAASFFIKDIAMEPAVYWRWVLIGCAAAVPILVPLVAVFTWGWRFARAHGKRRIAAAGVAVGGLMLTLVMAGLYLSAAGIFNWFLFTKI